MNSLRVRQTVWFASSLVLVLAVFVVFTYRTLDTELRNKHWQHDYPNHPDWTLHGSYSEEEIQDILGELVETSLLYGLPLALGALLMGYWLARKSVKPIARLNQQLQNIRAPDLSPRIELAEMDLELRDLVRHINDLLARLETAFKNMSEYSAKVAHELRTPLAILRLKLEHAGERPAPELAEELQSELHQLSHVVDQSLLIAKAEQGRLKLRPQVFNLGQMVADIAEDFSLLAKEEGRGVNLDSTPTANVMADPTYTRQIIHNFFANALRHGRGEVRVRLKSRKGVSVLTIANWIRTKPVSPTDTLGLGLRVVNTLLGLQSRITYRRQRSPKCYGVRLTFPAAAETSATDKTFSGSV